MGIPNKKIIFIGLIFLSFSLDSYAEVIYLKSGKTAEGAILDRKANGDIKVDIAGVPVEFFRDDILGVQENNYREIVQNIYSLGSKSPEKVVTDYCNAILAQDIQQAYKKLTKRKYDAVKDIPFIFMDKNVERWKYPHSFQVLTETISGNKSVVKVLFETGSRKFEQTFILTKEHADWKIDSYEYNDRDFNQENANVLEESLPSVSGHVNFPVTKHHGKLLIVFLPYNDVMKNGRSLSLTVSVNEDMLSKGSNKIPYIVENFTPGTYKGFAVWDIEAPFLDNAFEKKGNFNFKGDFIGQIEPVKLDYNVNLRGVDFQLKLF